MPTDLNDVLKEFTQFATRYSKNHTAHLNGLRPVSEASMKRMLQSISIGKSEDESGIEILDIHVQDKRHVDCLLVRWLREQADGRVVVTFTGPVRASTGTTKVRPLEIGFSVSMTDRKTAGTIGFQANRNGVAGIVSCAHVIVDDPRQKDGANSVIQPGLSDLNGAPENFVATAVKWTILKPSGNVADAAFAEIDHGVGFSPQLPSGLPQISGAAAPAFKGQAVHKAGRTTGVTHGVVDSINRNGIFVDFGRLGNVFFDSVITVRSTGKTAFSDFGDSGALVVDDGGNAVGLIFADANGRADDPNRLCYVCAIQPILAALELTIVP